MLFLEDLKITGKKIFLFGFSSKYSDYIVKLLTKNEINVHIWDPNTSLMIKNRDRIEYNNKHITFIDPKDTNFNINEYEYIIISKCFSKNTEYYNLFNKNNVREKICTDFDIINKIHSNVEFTAIVGQYGGNIIQGVLEHVKKEFELDLDKKISSEEELNKNKINIPVLVPFEKIKYIKNAHFSSIIVYDYSKSYFLNKENIKKFNRTILNNNEINIIVNIDNTDLKNWYEKLQNNKEYAGNLIPISVSKILNHGISFINNTIYDYYNDNLNYDIMENEYIDNDFTKLAILITYVFNKKNNILNGKNLIQCLSTYTGEKNFLEHIKNIENIQVINNTSVDSEYLLKLPYNTYENIYSVLIVNNKEYDKKFFENKSRVVFYIDKYGFIKDNTNNNVFNNEEEALKKIYSLCLLENKENKVTLLISTVSINKHISFNKEIESIISTLYNI